jgi:hypothetical protein
MWLASPSNNTYGDLIMDVRFGGSLRYCASYNSEPGLRPFVSLKTGYKLQETDDDKLKLVSK